MLRPGTSAKAILLFAVLQGATSVTRSAASPHQTDPALARLFPAKPTGYLTDPAAVLNAGQVQRISAIAERLRNATGAEIATVVLPTIGDRAAVDVAVAIGRAWGVGAKAEVGDQRRNAGVVILLVPKRAGDSNSGQIFIASGQGVEGIVTDLRAGQVRDLMRPYFQRDDYAGGLEAGVHALAGLIAQGMGISDSVLTSGTSRLSESPPASGGARPPPLILVVGLVVFAIFFAAIATASRRGRRGRGGIFWGGGFGGGGGGGGGFGGFGGFGGGGGGGGFGGFGGGGGFSGGGAGGRF